MTKACEDGSGRTDPPGGPQTLKGRVGRCFLQYAQFLKLYSIYYNGFDNALAFLDRLDSDKPPARDAGTKKDPTGLPQPSPKTIKRFRQHVEKARQSPKHTQINLQAWLLLPVQRLPRYKMLLEKLWECTDPSHPDNEDLEKAMEEISARVRECNERKREWEGVTSVVDGVIRQIKAPEDENNYSGSSPSASPSPGSPMNVARSRQSAAFPSRASSLAVNPPGSPSSPVSASLTTLSTGSALLRLFSTRRKLLKASPWRIIRVVVRGYILDPAFAGFFGLAQAPPDVLVSSIPVRSSSNVIPPSFLIRQIGVKIKEGIPLLPGTIIPATPKEAGRDDELILFADVLLWCKSIDPTSENPDQRYELIKAFDLDRAGDSSRGIARIMDAADLPWPLPGIPRDDDGKVLRITDPGGECVVYAVVPRDAEGEGEAFADAVNFGGAI